jgi:hypothetical protein
LVCNVLNPMDTMLAGEGREIGGNRIGGVEFVGV